MPFTYSKSEIFSPTLTHFVNEQVIKSVALDTVKKYVFKMYFQSIVKMIIKKRNWFIIKRNQLWCLHLE